MHGQILGEKLSIAIPQSLGAREFMIERLILRDNVRDHLRKLGRNEQDMEEELLALVYEYDQAVSNGLQSSESSRNESIFLLAQFYYDIDEYQQAWKWYSKLKDIDLRALYQLAVISFEGVLPTECSPTEAYNMMYHVANKEKDPHDFVIPYAQFHLGKAHFQGYGVDESEEEAERYWLMAASGEYHNPVVEAETALAFFYSRKPSTFYSINKTYYWHDRAARHGSLESLGAIGAMKMFGIATKQNFADAIENLREASERGNVYSMGLLVYAYYMRKLFTKATDLAKRVIALNDIDELARISSCLPTYIKKGIAIAAFILGRCFHLGHGIKPDPQEALVMYKKSFQYDPDVCQLLQDYVAHEKV